MRPVDSLRSGFSMSLRVFADLPCSRDFHSLSMTPVQSRCTEHLLLAMVSKLNKLAVEPEWYHSLLTTCNTSIVNIVNQITPGRIPFLWRNFLPGYTPKAALRLKLIEDWGGLENTLAAGRVDEVAQRWSGDGDYSAMLRAHLPSRQPFTSEGQPPIDRNHNAP